VSSREDIEEAISLGWLKDICTAIISKLGQLKCKFFIIAVHFYDRKGAITLSQEDYFDFLNSLNAAGGLMDRVSTRSAQPVKIQRYGPNRVSIMLKPIYVRKLMASC